MLPLESPSDAIKDQAVTARQTVTKLVVVTTSQACNNARYPEQKDLVNSLLQASRPLVAVAVRQSHGIASCTAVRATLAIYGFNPASLRMLFPYGFAGAYTAERRRQQCSRK